MKAAVVHELGSPPVYEDFAEPVPGPEEQLVTVRAAGLHPLVKGLAAGKHYAAKAQPPLIPGIDGVGHTADGRRVYFGGIKLPYGTMAERATASRHAFELPDALSDSKCAALMNPGMSSWLALVERARFEPGETVMVIGATGAAGRLALQVAKKLGAGRIIAAARDRAALEALPADLHLGIDELARVSEEKVDVVLDYVWGPPAEATLAALRGRTRYVQIGAMAGDPIRLPSAVLRSTGITISGSGLGSVPMETIVREMPRFLAMAPDLEVDVLEVPLRDVNQAWNERTGARRLVFVP